MDTENERFDSTRAASEGHVCMLVSMRRPCAHSWVPRGIRVQSHGAGFGALSDPKDSGDHLQ